MPTSCGETLGSGFLPIPPAPSREEKPGRVTLPGPLGHDMEQAIPLLSISAGKLPDQSPSGRSEEMVGDSEGSCSHGQSVDTQNRRCSASSASPGHLEEQGGS